MKKLLDYVVLPREVTAFEVSYLARINRIALWFFVAHVPVLTALASANGTGALTALVLTSLVCVGPLLGARTLQHPRHQSIILGVTAMLMGALLVYFGQGPMQIEMHFYFFVLLALETVFANPLVILVSAVTVALHHLLLFFLFPSAVYNYDATIWTVLVHALFVVLESAAAVFVARSFFDDVIGLERIVEARTGELAERNAAMRLVLDHINDGLATIDGAGRLSGERSRRFDQWFTNATPGMPIWEAMGAADPAAGTSMEMAWDEVAAGVMPMELTMDQLPRRLRVDGRRIDVHYVPLGAADPPEQTLVIMRDVTDELARAEADRQSGEAVRVLDRARADLGGFTALAETGERALAALDDAGPVQTTTLLRLVHTLKGNAGIYGLTSVAEACHAIEDRVTETGERPSPALVEELRVRWRQGIRLASSLVDRRREYVEVAATTVAMIEDALAVSPRGAPVLAQLKVARMVPVRTKLEQFAQQAERIAHRLGKDVTIDIDDRGLRMDPAQWGDLWLALVHTVRNAVDHGIELPEQREARGKSRTGVLHLRTHLERDQFVIEIEDDGAGIDFDALRQRAASKGIVDMADQQLLGAGVSTASAVTSVSGRGVGMGALYQAVRACGGSVHVDSERGSGSTVRVRVPAEGMIQMAPPVRQVTAA